MKRLLTIPMVLILAFALVACSNSRNSAPEKDVKNETSTLAVLDLTGGWKQTNSNSDTNYQVAMIDDNTIEIYWKGENDSLSLYWAGTYNKPVSEKNEFSWDSVNDKSRTDSALLASMDDKKTFTHKNGIISYSVSALGVTKTFTLKRSDDVKIKVRKAVSVEKLLPLELVECGYTASKSSDGYYIHYAFILKNPNVERAVEFPKVRLTARDSKGQVLGTDDITGSVILPNNSYYAAFLGPKVDSKPATVDFEIIQPEARNWILPDSVEYAGKALVVQNPIRQKDKIVGEVSNPNNFDIDGLRVVVVFRDKDGKLLSGETTFTDKILANGKIPFEIPLWGLDENSITDNFEVHAYPWD